MEREGTLRKTIVVEVTRVTRLIIDGLNLLPLVLFAFPSIALDKLYLPAITDAYQCKNVLYITMHIA